MKLYEEVNKTNMYHIILDTWWKLEVQNDKKIEIRSLRTNVLDSEDTKFSSTKVDRQLEFNKDDTSWSRIFPGDLIHLPTKHHPYHLQYLQSTPGRSSKITLQQHQL